MQISVCELILFHVLRHGDVNSSKRSDLLDHVIQVQSCFGTMILPLFYYLSRQCSVDVVLNFLLVSESWSRAKRPCQNKFVLYIFVTLFNVTTPNYFIKIIELYSRNAIVTNYECIYLSTLLVIDRLICYHDDISSFSDNLIIRSSGMRRIFRKQRQHRNQKMFRRNVIARTR